MQHTIPTLEASAVKHMPVSKRIVVVSEEESYLYFGRLIDGLRQGRGQNRNGKRILPPMTAITGDDKRDGFGAYYYKIWTNLLMLEIGRKTNATV